MDGGFRIEQLVNLQIHAHRNHIAFDDEAIGRMDVLRPIVKTYLKRPLEGTWELPCFGTAYSAAYFLSLNRRSEASWQMLLENVWDHIDNVIVPQLQEVLAKFAPTVVQVSRVFELLFATFDRNLRQIAGVYCYLERVYLKEDNGVQKGCWRRLLLRPELHTYLAANATTTDSGHESVAVDSTSYVPRSLLDQCETSIVRDTKHFPSVTLRCSLPPDVENRLLHLRVLKIVEANAMQRDNLTRTNI